MATRTLVTPEQYLQMPPPEPDVEFVDGELVERNVGDYIHGKVVARLAEAFALVRRSHGLYPVSDTRVRVRPGLFRIPDFSVFAGEEPSERVPGRAPLIVVEVASPDDRLSESIQKLEEYSQWCVSHIWLVDPTLRKLYVYTAGLSEVASYRLPEFDLQITPADLFE